MKKICLILCLVLGLSPVVMAQSYQESEQPVSDLANLQAKMADIVNRTQFLESAERRFFDSVKEFDGKFGSGSAFKALGMSSQAIAEELAAANLYSADTYLLKLKEGGADTNFVAGLFLRSLLQAYRWLVEAHELPENPDWGTVQDMIGRVRGLAAWHLEYPGMLPSEALLDMTTGTYIRDRVSRFQGNAIGNFTQHILCQELLTAAEVARISESHGPKLHLATARFLLAWLRASNASVVPEFLHESLLAELKLAGAKPETIGTTKQELRSLERTRHMEMVLNFLEYGLSKKSKEPGYVMAVINIAGVECDASGYSLEEIGIDPMYAKNIKAIYQKSRKHDQLVQKLTAKAFKIRK